MRGLYFLIRTQPPNMKTSVHYVDQMEFLDFPATTEHLVSSDIQKGGPAKKEYKDVVYCRTLTTALL